MTTILSIGPDRELLAQRNRALARLGYQVRDAATRTDAVNAARSQRFDLALLCPAFPRGYAVEFGRELAALMPATAILQLPDDGRTLTMDDIQQMIEGAVRRPEAA